MLKRTCPGYGSRPLPGPSVGQAAYQGNCKGVLRSPPSTASAVPISLFLMLAAAGNAQELSTPTSVHGEPSIRLYVIC